MIREPYVSVKRNPTAEEVQLVKRHGRRYHPALLPDDIEQGPIGQCFDWSMIQCMRLNEKYRYVEGLARNNGEKQWTLHAWLTDGVHAFDATWLATDKNGNRAVYPGEYIGIEMPLLAVMLFVKATEYQGVIPNRDKYPHTLQSIIGVGK